MPNRTPAICPPAVGRVRYAPGLPAKPLASANRRACTASSPRAATHVASHPTGTGRAEIAAVLAYVESHHWIFGLLALGYIFYLHDRALHARFDALEKRVDEIRKRLAIEY